MIKNLRYLSILLMLLAYNLTTTAQQTVKHKFLEGELKVGNITIEGVPCTLTVKGPTTPFFGWDKNATAKGIQIGKKNAPVKEVMLKTSAIPGAITAVKVNASTANDGKATLMVSVGGTTLGSTANLTNKATEYSFRGNATGELAITLQQPKTVVALYLKSIEVTIGGAVKQEAVLSFPEATYSINFGEPFTAPVLTKQTDGTVTYSSDNEAIAEVDASTGAVTVKKAGVAKITAKSAETATYFAGEASYTLSIVGTAANIASLKALGNGSSAKLTLTNAQVLYVGLYDMYVQDATGAIDFYKSGLPYTTGQVLNGTITVTYKEFHGLPEITNVTDNQLTSVAGTVIPEAKRLDDISLATDMCKLVKLTDVQIKAAANNKYYMVENGKEVQIYNKFQIAAFNTSQFPAGSTSTKKYNVVGVVVPYNNSPGIALTSFEEAGGTTVISTLEVDKLIKGGEVKIFDLQGRRVSHPAKGIYIINGKKYVVR